VVQIHETVGTTNVFVIFKNNSMTMKESCALLQILSPSQKTIKWKDGSFSFRKGSIPGK
jgi:hypothetical protein